MSVYMHIGFMGYNAKLVLILSLLVSTGVLNPQLSKEKAEISGNVTLSSQASCEGDKMWELLQDGVPHLVITCSQGNCNVGPHFQNRVQILDNTLIINQVWCGDRGWYMYYCNRRDIWSVHLDLQPYMKNINSSGNVTINLWSQDQVKLNFTQIGSSTPQTAFIVDNGRVFSDSQAAGGMTLSVQNGTMLLSNLVQGGMFTVIGSRSNKTLCEVDVTLIESDQEDHKKDVPSYNPDCFWSWSPCWMIGLSFSFNIIAIPLLIYAFLPFLRSVLCHHQTQDDQKDENGNPLREAIDLQVL